MILPRPAAGQSSYVQGKIDKDVREVYPKRNLLAFMNHPGQSLHQAGLKATKQRLLVLKALARARQPQSAEDIRRQLRSVDSVTIYRILEQLVERSLVSLVILGDGTKRYESKDHPHHHHLVCDNCGGVEDVVVPHDQKIVNAVAARHRFQARQHSMEFFGLCANCQ